MKVKILSRKYGHKVLSMTGARALKTIEELGGSEMVSIFDKDTVVPIEELSEHKEITLVPRFMGGRGPP